MNDIEFPKRILWYGSYKEERPTYLEFYECTDEFKRDYIIMGSYNNGDVSNTGLYYCNLFGLIAFKKEELNDRELFRILS